MKNGATHEFGYSGIWRQITSLAENASPSVRADAGDSFKSSITHTWIQDKRVYPLLPSSGYMMKTVSELAGWGPLKGDTAFWKSEVESQVALPFGNTGITLTAGLRGGLLYPMKLAGEDKYQASRINDRFQLGGPNNVRGFRLAGLGPRDGSDALGGDIYAAGGASLLLPIPRVGKETPLRLQAFYYYPSQTPRAHIPPHFRSIPANSNLPDSDARPRAPPRRASPLRLPHVHPRPGARLEGLG